MREFRSISASQLYDFRACRRLWWFGYVLGLEKKERASAALGTEVHAHLQKYLDDGTKPPDTESGRIARAGLSLLPEPGTVYTEVAIKDEESAWPRPVVLDVPVNGIVDVLDLTAEPPLVLDHKSTSDLKWAKTEAELLEDPQGIIYGRFALGVVENMGVVTDRVTFGHVVYLTRGGPLAKKTTVTLTREHIDTLWKQSLEPDVREMKEVAKARVATDVPGNRESCNNYGGCHFKDRCRALGMAVDVEVPAFIARAGLFGQPSTPAPLHREPLTGSGSPAMSGVHLSTPSNPPAPEPPVTTTPAALDPMDALKRLKAKKAADAAAGGGTPPAAAPENPVQPTPPPADAGSAGAPKTSDEAKQSILAKYGIKSKGGTDAPATGSNGIVPGDAPPQVSSLASGTAPEKTGSETPSTAGTGAGSEGGEAKPARKPPGFAAKLTALFWTAEQVARMHPDAMRTAIEGKLDGREYSVRTDGSIYKPGVGPVEGTPEPAGKDVRPLAGKPDGTVWYYHAESDSFAALTYEQWNTTSEKGLLVHVGDDAAKAEVEAFLKAQAAQMTVEPGPVVLRVLHDIAKIGAPQVKAPTEPSPAARDIAALLVEKTAQQLAAPRLVLYVDCVPEKGRDRPYQMLEELVAPLLPVAVEMHNRAAKKDEEKADFYSLIPYNRGPGYVASLLLKNPPTGVIVCNTRMPATNGCLEVLIPMADVVIRAIR